jgi:hypothetical protein
MIRLIGLSIIFSFTLSCSPNLDTSNPPEIENNPSEWYPKTLGFWTEYSIDSTTYRLQQGDTQVIISNSTSYFREEIEDSIPSFDTPRQFRIRASWKRSMTDNFQFYRYYSLLATSSYIVKNIDNQRYVKLQAPIRNELSWKGHRMLDSVSPIFSNWNYTYTKVNEPLTKSSNYFDKTITVIQIADSNAIEYRYSMEVYAKDIGLVYSELSILEKQNGANPWSKPENGYTIRKKITNWKR